MIGKRFAGWMLGASLAALVAGAAVAASFPERPVRIVVPYAAGGGTDIITRMLAERMSFDLGQNVIVENKPGATGTIAAEYVAKAPADGYTLLMAATSTLTITPNLREGLRYAPTDFTPVNLVVHQPFFLVSSPELAASTVSDLIALARANPGKLTYASFGAGSPPHMGTELLKAATGIDLVHVPYKGGAPALVDLVASRVSVMFVDAPPIVQHVASGKLKVLGVSTTDRTALMPDVPAVSETVPGFHFSAWFGLVVPKGTPSEAVERLAASVTRVLADDDLRRRLAELGSHAAAEGPAAFARLIAAENDKWRTLIRTARIQAN